MRAYLVVGLLVVAAMTLILVLISEDVVNHEGRELWTAADAPVGTWLQGHGSPWLTSAMRVATSFGSPVVVTGVAVTMALYLLRRQRFYWLAALVLSVPGGALVNRILKEAVHRARPDVGDPVVSAAGYSFPSGHTLMALVLYGVVAACVCAHTRDWRLRLLTVASASVLVGLVGVSRVYLGAHYVSDVLGAAAEGLAWLSLTLTAIYTMWHRRHRVPAPRKG